VKSPDDQLVLTDGQRAHNGSLYGRSRESARLHFGGAESVRGR
jgi:hypothetical protein